MIKIEISETRYPGNPFACQIPCSQLDIFLEGFKELCNKTGMHKVNLTKVNNGVWVPTQLRFDDGTYVGISRLFEEIGFNDEK